MAVAVEKKVEPAMVTLKLEVIQQGFTFWPTEQLVLSGLKAKRERVTGFNRPEGRGQ